MAVAIEDEFGVEIPDREALGIETVGDTIKLIEKYMNAKTDYKQRGKVRTKTFPLFCAKKHRLP